MNKKMPKKVPVEPGSGGGAYPEDDIGYYGTQFYGNRWSSNKQKKKYMTMRGGGAAKRGKRFLDWD